MRLPLARIVPVTVALGAAVVLGALGALPVRFDGGPVFQVVGIVFSGGWSWACFAFLVGGLRPSKAEAALLAPVALAVGVVVYYLIKVAGSEAPGGDPTTQILVWGAAAFLFGAPMGLFGNLARNPGVSGLPLRLLVPLIAWYETSRRLEVEAAAAGPVAAGTWSAIRVAAVLTAAALVGHAAWRWRTRRDGRGAGAGAGTAAGRGRSVHGLLDEGGDAGLHLGRHLGQGEDRRPHRAVVQPGEVAETEGGVA
ncbi:hypothetical protein M2167_006086 [Streptomyces sp. SPB4]|nr:hypothetical protein [Streptomyces sp. SPB4]